MIRRINLLGGPGAGKSTTAAWLFAHLKLAGFKCELVMEVAKVYAWENREIAGFQQHKIFGKQMIREETPLKGGAKFIVTDSPIMLSAFYGAKFKLEGWETFLTNAREFEREYPSHNVFLVRDPKKEYDPLGRFQTKEQALEIDNEVEKMLQVYNLPYARWQATAREELLKDLKERILS